MLPEASTPNHFQKLILSTSFEERNNVKMQSKNKGMTLRYKKEVKIRTMNKILLTAILLFVGFVGFSQYTFTGKVVDENGEPLVGASVLEKGTENVSITDGEGIYRLEADEAKIDVIFSFMGEPIQKRLTANKFLVLNLSQSLNIEPVFVSEKYPVTETTTSIDNEINLGQDIPTLLDQLPSVVTTSDAGAGIGYTGIRVRGSDATRVNVTINGVPLNDSESQGVFWVNMPDFASSTEKVTLVRGVGTSTNGAGAFGASLHIETEDISEEAYVEYNGSIGSFNTWKNNIQFGSGEKNGWSASGRLSRITSDGFVDRASSDLNSYFLQGQKEYGDYNKGGALKFITFKGHEVTYQSWFGVNAEQLAESRTFNPYTYENQVDDYTQEHFQLHNENWFNENIRTHIGLHYTVGEGFFEEFREGDDLANYGITSNFSATSDLVRRRWLDNDFYGAIGSVDIYSGDHYLNIGGGYNQYLGDHFGEVIQGEFVPTEAIGENYYFNDATKRDGNIYAKYTYDLTTDWGLVRPYVDLQFRGVGYEFVGLALDGNGTVQELPQEVNYNFFNPKFGATIDFGNSELYASFARAQKEPNRGDFVDSPASQLPLPEELNDYELGFTTNKGNFSGAINGYYMDYKNQLAVTGGVNDVGAYTRVNIDDSYRAGIELLVNYQLNRFTVSLNGTLSQNRVNTFIENLELYDENFSFLGFQEIVHEDTDLALSPNVVAGGTITYSSKNGLFTTSSIGKYVGQQILDNTSTDARSLDAFFVNNLTTSLDLGQLVPQLSAFEINMLVNNVFDVEYESNGYTFGYQFDGTDIYENFFYPQAGTNFLTGLKVRF